MRPRHEASENVTQAEIARAAGIPSMRPRHEASENGVAVVWGSVIAQALQ